MPSPEEDDEEADNGMDSDDSDRKSKMSFSYWGADKVTLQKPSLASKATTAKPSVGGVGMRARPGSSTPSGYNRESSANAKFGTRLIVEHGPAGAGAGGVGGPRSASRRTMGTPTTGTTAGTRRHAASDEGHNGNSVVKVTTTSNRPAWNSSRTATPTSTAPGAMRRPRNVSQNSSATRETARGGGAGGMGGGKVLASPAPSEDSGVGLYRKMMAVDPSLNAD